MNTVLSKLILCCSLLLLCSKLDAANYYLSDRNGNDSRSAAQAQNPNTPWKTINKLNSFFSGLNPGDNVYFQRGDTFYGAIQIANSGRSGSPITFGAYGSGADPIITSLVSLSNWKSVGSGVYESSNGNLPNGEVNVVLVNDLIQEMGRYPNSDAAEKGYLTYDSHSGNTSITDNDLSSSPNWTGGEVVIRKLYWITDRHKITNHSGNRISYGPNPDTDYEPRDGYGYFIQNHPSTLDKYGEWYYDRSKKAVRVYFGSDPGSTVVEASTFDHLVSNQSGTNYITFENLHFKGANRNAFSLKGGNNLKISNCKIEFSGENGLDIAGIPDLIVENSEVLGSNNIGMNIKSSDNVTIRNNVINKTYLFPGHGRSGDNNGLSLLSTGNSNIIEFNEIRESGYIGIRFGGNNSEVRNNYVNEFCLTKNDGAGIYSYTNKNSSFKNRKVTNNIVLNGKGVLEGSSMDLYLARAQAEGIYMDDNVSGVEISGNTVAHMSSKGIYLHNARDINIHNNTVYDADYLIYLRNDHMGNAVENNKIENNNLMTRDAFQDFVQINSQYDDVSKMAVFNNNRYSSPLSDNIRFQIKYNAGTSNQVNLTYDLEGWQKKFGKDMNSNVGNQVKDRYTVTNEIGKNRYNNGTFDKNVDYVSCSNCQDTWENGKLDNGTLKVTTKGNSQTVVTIGELKKGRTYRLKLSGIGNQNIPITAFLRQASSPYQTISANQNFLLSTKRKEVEIIFEPVADVNTARLVMEVASGSASDFWLDNIEFQEVAAEVVRPEDKIMFHYNAKKSKTSINTGVGFTNILDQEISNTISLEPYSSLLLIKTSDGDIAQAPIDSPKITITNPNNNQGLAVGSTVLIETEASISNGVINKVDFFNGTTKLGSASVLPFNYLWENVPAGNHLITAVATADNGEQTTSGQVKLVMKSTTVAEEPSSVYFLNAGSNYNTIIDPLKFNGENNDSRFYTNSNSYENKNASGFPLFQTERYGRDLSYEIPVINGVYYVYTLHNELYFGRNGPSSKAGNRVFDISIENKIVQEKVDPFIVNKNEPFVLSFDNIRVSDGVLNIDFNAFSNNASISGIIVSQTPVTIPNSLQPVDSDGAVPVEISEDLILINAGSKNDVTHETRLFVGDGKTNYFSNSSLHTNLSAAKEPLFQTERYGKNMGIKIPIENGMYTVKTYHNELWFGTYGPPSAIGNRVFDISIEGKTLKRGFDLFAEYKNQPTVLTFKNITVEDGNLEINFNASKDNATISGIMITKMESDEPVLVDATPPANSQSALFLNSGTFDKVSYSGSQFEGDKNTDFHNTSSRSNFNLSVKGSSLFLTERYGSQVNYNVPVENGNYTVITYHNELWFGSFGPAARPGNRVFNIDIEGKRVKSNVDLYMENGNNPLTLTFNNIMVSDGVLNLDLSAVSNNVTIAGLAIIPETNGNNSRRMTDGESRENEIMGEASIFKPSSITVFPNPANHQTTVALGQDVAVQEIFLQSSNGALVKSIDPVLASDGFGNFHIPLDNVKAGIYILTITDRKQFVEKVKLIIN
jgi:parallel beta-helix repeat protein